MRQILWDFILRIRKVKSEEGRESQRLPLMPGAEEIIDVIVIGCGIPTLGTETVPLVKIRVGGQTVRPVAVGVDTVSYTHLTLPTTPYV